MKVYTVLQRQFADENFGDLDSIFHGVFSSLEKAQEYISTIKVETHRTLFGVNTESLHIIEGWLDAITVNNNWSQNTLKVCLAKKN
jgi:hypothetical protein